MPGKLELIRPYAERWRYRDSVDRRAVHRFTRDQIAHGMSSNEFYPAYQPQIDLATHQVHGFEALARWIHPTCGVVGPGDFIPQIESFAQSAELSLRLLDRALVDYRTFRDRGFHGRIAINVTQTAIELEGFGEVCCALLDAHQISGSCLTLELTEHGAAFDSTYVEANLRSLTSCNVLLAIDDFWVGHSSLEKKLLNYFGQIKLDTDLVQGASTDPISRAGVAAICAFADTLEWTCVAEGVEADGDLELVRELSIKLGQGFYFSAPMFRDRVHEWLVERSG